MQLFGVTMDENTYFRIQRAKANLSCCFSQQIHTSVVVGSEPQGPGCCVRILSSEAHRDVGLGIAPAGRCITPGKEGRKAGALRRPLMMPHISKVTIMQSENLYPTAYKRFLKT